MYFYAYEYTSLVMILYRSKHVGGTQVTNYYRGADKSLARLTSRCILFDGENISFDSSLVK